MQTIIIASIQTFITVVANIIIGKILIRQIKSQREIIESYNGPVEATNPEKIMALHDREVTKIKETLGKDIEELKTQVYGLTKYTDTIVDAVNDLLNRPFFSKYKKIYTRKEVVDEEFPHCKKILEDKSESFRTVGFFSRTQRCAAQVCF